MHPNESDYDRLLREERRERARARRFWAAVLVQVALVAVAAVLFLPGLMAPPAPPARPQAAAPTLPPGPWAHRAGLMGRSAELRQALLHLAAEPCHRQAFGRLIVAYEQAGELRALAQDLDAFEARCGPMPVARLNAVRALMTLSDYNLARAAADRLVTEQAETPDAWAIRAEVREAQGDLPGAAEDLRQALALFPDPAQIDGTSWYRLTKVLEKQGAFCAAMVPLQSFVAFDVDRRRNRQTTALLAQLGEKGQCASGQEHKTVRIGLSPGANTILVTARINGQRGRFVVDTGATEVAIDHEFATRAQVDMDPQASFLVHTANGVQHAHPGLAQTITLQGLKAERVAVSVRPRGAPPLAPGVDGLLGLSFLARFDMRLNPDSLTLTTLD